VARRRAAPPVRTVADQKERRREIRAGYAKKDLPQGR